MAAWVDLTNGDITWLRQMPDKAQRELSKSVVKCEVSDFEQGVRQSVTQHAVAAPTGRWLGLQHATNNLAGGVGHSRGSRRSGTPSPTQPIA